MTISAVPEPEAELQAGVAWVKDCAPGCGPEFSRLTFPTWQRHCSPSASPAVKVKVALVDNVTHLTLHSIADLAFTRGCALLLLLLLLMSHKRPHISTIPLQTCCLPEVCLLLLTSHKRPHINIFRYRPAVRQRLLSLTSHKQPLISTIPLRTCCLPEVYYFYYWRHTNNHIIISTIPLRTCCLPEVYYYYYWRHTNNHIIISTIPLRTCCLPEVYYYYWHHTNNHIIISTIPLQTFARDCLVLLFFSSVQFKMESVRSEKPVCAPPSLSEVTPALSLKRFQCSSDWRWPSLGLSRKIVQCFLTQTATQQHDSTTDLPFARGLLSLLTSHKQPHINTIPQQTWHFS